ncbi:Maf family protein [Umezawaea sp. Da 62-37]|uniref:Maf family protein n=1 Tax=Umezawaea sp. Da 62-37 TaxID=3075927 RepID=UPI0028F747A3|nr:Maf family protein [Umezawaea sp. Da 62-37]WNV90660.1 Maf family protein [Umezawaea sp. Da 62-37]
MRLVLASASPARLSVLRAAGIEPVVRVSGVDEDAVAAALVDPKPAEVVTALAVAKAEAVLPLVATEFPDSVVIGCDSMLLTADGTLEGKPGTVEAARDRWRRMAGTSGTLLTGHCLLRLRGGEVVGRAAGSEQTTIRFGRPSEEDLEAYLATGEPLQVAGAFTLDGLGGWFVDGIDGDPSSVIGISLPLTRGLLAEVGVAVSTLW